MDEMRFLVMRPFLVLMLMLLWAPTLPCQFVVPLPTQGNSLAWRQHILPSPNELEYEKIPWIDSFAEGLLAANAQQKPLLFWAMNGHPLGCT